MVRVRVSLLALFPTLLMYLIVTPQIAKLL
jgi:hypothetical protein